jgi:hypothetical protein
MIQRLFRLFSIGDPRWGRQSDQNDARPPGGEQPPRSEPPKQQRPGSEPPDLDEVWRDFNRKLGGLFGGKGQRGRGPRNPWGGGGGNGQGPSGGLPQFQVSKGLVGVVLLAFFGLYLASGFYIVQEGQTGVVLRFGQYQYATGAGFKWRMPYPFESHEVVNLAQLRQATVGFKGDRAGQGRDSLMLTKDENMIDIQFAVQYRVSKPEDYLFLPQYVENRDYALRQMSRQFDQLLAIAQLKTNANGESRTLYSLRHTSIMFCLTKGDQVNLIALARNARTSTEMIDRFYAKHLTAEMNIEQLQSRRIRKSAVEQDDE